MFQDTFPTPKSQVQAGYAAYLGDRCRTSLQPLLRRLNAQIDRRLVQTFLGLVMVIVMHRHRQHGLVVSELGGFLLGPAQAVAGTKRLSKLLHSPKWAANLIEDYLWETADRRVQTLRATGETVLAVWDESVLEKPESLKAERLCAVRSSKAVRLKRIKPGFYNPPGGRPICVPGFHWLQVLVLGMQGPPTLAHLRWWTTRGPHQSQKRDEAGQVLQYMAHQWRTQVIHIFDRGFAGNPWLTGLLLYGVNFILRWPKNYRLLNEHGQVCTPGQLSKGRRSWDTRQLWDAKRHCKRSVGVIAFPVQDPTHQQALWLVVARRKNQPPWYLLTDQPAHSPEKAWPIVLAYARRWQIEMAIRFHKCELAFESPRLSAWQARHKLLLAAALAYAFLLALLHDDPVNIVHWLLQNFCPRNGKWQQHVLLPLYRLRFAISQLWLRYPPLDFL